MCSRDSYINWMHGILLFISLNTRELIYQEHKVKYRYISKTCHAIHFYLFRIYEYCIVFYLRYQLVLECFNRLCIF